MAPLEAIIGEVRAHAPVMVSSPSVAAVVVVSCAEATVVEVSVASSSLLQPLSAATPRDNAASTVADRRMAEERVGVRFTVTPFVMVVKVLL